MKIYKEKHIHIFSGLNNNSIGYYGILLYCIHCAKPFTYDEEFNLISLSLTKSETNLIKNKSK